MRRQSLGSVAGSSARLALAAPLVLLIEPSPLVRISLGRYLERHFGAVVAVAEADQVGVALGDRIPTHLVCAGRVAWRVLEWRARWELDRLVVLTGAVDPPEVVPGVDAVLSKPVDPAHLVQCLRQSQCGFGASNRGGVP